MRMRTVGEDARGRAASCCRRVLEWCGGGSSACLAPLRFPLFPGARGAAEESITRSRCAGSCPPFQVYFCGVSFSKNSRDQTFSSFPFVFSCLFTCCSFAALAGLLVGSCVGAEVQGAELRGHALFPRLGCLGFLCFVFLVFGSFWK